MFFKSEGGKKIQWFFLCRAVVCKKMRANQLAFLVKEAGMARSTTQSPINTHSCDYSNFVRTIANYCEAQLAVAREKKANPRAAGDLVSMFTCLFPGLASHINPGTSEHIYAIRIMAFGVKGLKDEVYETIWQKYFLDGERISQLAKLLFYSERQLRRKIALFPKRVADQLAERNEGGEAWSIPPKTELQGNVMLLQKEYRLTLKQATVLWAFLKHDHTVGRKAIANELGISIETLRDHISSIIRRMGVDKLNQAVDRARKILQDDYENCDEELVVRARFLIRKEDYLNVE